MHFDLYFKRILLGIFFMQFFSCESLPCDSCGKECASACGTKHFRTCCFNYLRKRADPNALKMKIMNKRLIDIMMLQGQALVTQNDFTNSRDNDNNNDIGIGDDGDNLEPRNELSKYPKQFIKMPYLFTLHEKNEKGLKKILTLRSPLQSQLQSRLLLRQPQSYLFNNTFVALDMDLRNSFYND